MRYALALVLVLVLTPAFAQEDVDPVKAALGPELVRAIEGATSIHVFAIEPQRATDEIHVAGHPVKRVMALEPGKGAGRRLRAVLLDGASWGGAPGDSFLPLEAIRLRSKDGVATLLVSLECRAVRWVEGDRVIAAVPGGPLAQALEAALAGGEPAPEAANGDAAAKLAQLMMRYQLMEDVAREREAAADARVDFLIEDIKALQGREKQLVGEREALRGEKRELVENLEEVHLLMKGLETVVRQTTDALEEKTRLLDEMKKAGGAEAANVDRVKEVLDETRAQLQSAMAKNAELARENERLRAELDRARSAPPVEPPVEAGPIDGSVTAVDSEAGLVLVDRGRSHGVTKGTVLTIYRGDQLVGRAVVEQVFSATSSALIDRTITTQPVQTGDLVTSRIR